MPRVVHSGEKKNAIDESTIAPALFVLREAEDLGASKPGNVKNDQLPGVGGSQHRSRKLSRENRMRFLSSGAGRSDYPIKLACGSAEEEHWTERLAKDDQPRGRPTGSAAFYEGLGNTLACKRGGVGYSMSTQQCASLEFVSKGILQG